MKDITLGKYFPGDSLIHRLDPRTKLIAVFAYIVVLFLAKGLLSYLILFAFLALTVAISGIHVKNIIRGIRPLVLILTITSLLNMFYTPGETLVAFWIIVITREGIVTACYMIARILMLISATFLLTFTTSPIMLTAGMEKLFRPLTRLRVPVHEMAMMMTIALRFVPTLIEEAEKIMNAQKARGADFESGNLLKRAKALLPLLIPLFISAMRRAAENTSLSKDQVNDMFFANAAKLFGVK